MPLGYRVFSGNTEDVTTVEEIVEAMEKQYGVADRVWVMDRGMVSEDNLKFFRAGNFRYIIGTPKSMLKKFEAELLAKDWHEVRGGLEVKLCKRDDLAAGECFVVCRSADRRKKDEAILRRSEEKIEARLKTMTERCLKQNRDVQKVEREIGKLLGKNTRAAKLFEVVVKADESGAAKILWKKITLETDWAKLSAGCYLLRTNVTDWKDEDLWRAYTQLSEAENAFRIHKTDLQLRSIWHQEEDRLEAHLLVCFLAYVLLKSLGRLCARAGLGDEPRRVLEELSEIRPMDVVLPTSAGHEIRRRWGAIPFRRRFLLAIAFVKFVEGGPSLLR
ncbi:Transposase DDE domain protein [Stieleria varia]|uniref:Transposase DDE domain protein n=1 Tax=Stieleria varia TaxID=2528005 RepID=A0A5C6AGY0_9BACT|nr:Transposase DDE domain protein [Stieleria varia]